MLSRKNIILLLPQWSGPYVIWKTGTAKGDILYLAIDAIGMTNLLLVFR
jgi:hypothetical protein